MTVILSFTVFLVCFAVIGMLSARHREATTADYLVAGRQIGPWLTALSSMATNNSGYAFIGLVGFAYRFGIQSIWLSIAWVLGDLLVWLFVHRRVRAFAGKTDARSVPAMLASAGKDKSDGLLAMICGLITFAFLAVYAAAQLKAGGTTLHSLFGWDREVGAVIGAVIVVLYCFSGGIRASIWTDAAQSVVMIGGMAAVVSLCVSQVGGPQELVAALGRIDPALASLFPADLQLFFPLYFLGFVAGGFGAIGAPHILIRSMALDSQKNFARTRRIYLTSFIPFVLASAVIGLYARVILPELAVAPGGLSPASSAAAVVRQAESALPLMAAELLPDVLVGMMLAAIFAAVMSTADSQILSCSAAVTQDIVPRWRSSYLAAKTATLGVSLAALIVALFAGRGVFVLVLVAWSALAATLGPILLVRLAGLPLSRGQAIAMMAAGLITVIAWDRSAWAGDVYNLLPGLLVPALIFAIFHFLRESAATPSGSESPQ